MDDAKFKIGGRVVVADHGSEHFGRGGAALSAHANGDAYVEWYYEVLFDGEAGGPPATARIAEAALEAE
jgi:hypothetical protein